MTFGLAEDEDASPIRRMSKSTLEKRSGSDPKDEAKDSQSKDVSPFEVSP